MAKSFIQTHHNIGEFLHTGKIAYAIQYRPSKFCSDDFLERDVQSGPISFSFIFLGDFIISYGSFYILFFIFVSTGFTHITHFLHTHFVQTFHYFLLFLFFFGSHHFILFYFIFISMNNRNGFLIHQSKSIYIYLYLYSHK